MRRSTHGPLSSAVKHGIGGGRSVTDSGGPHGLLMVMLIEIASVLCHRVLQKAVNMCKQLNITLIRLTTQTDTGIVVTS